MKFSNQGSTPLSVAVKDQSYKTGSHTKKLTPGRMIGIPLDLRTSHGWYDFIVGVEGFDLQKRYAGRVEAGVSALPIP